MDFQVTQKKDKREGDAQISRGHACNSQPGAGGTEGSDLRSRSPEKRSTERLAKAFRRVGGSTSSGERPAGGGRMTFTEKIDNQINESNGMLPKKENARSSADLGGEHLIGPYGRFSVRRNDKRSEKSQNGKGMGQTSKKGGT